MIKKYLFAFILILLTLPLIQSFIEIIRLEPLSGALVSTDNVNFNSSDWKSGIYQERKEKYINESFGLRNFFIRVNNQLVFSLFDKAKANGVIVGKEHFLFEENYIKAYYGADFIGLDSITERIDKLKFIQDTLSKLNKTLIIVYAAGKGSYYPEYFPDSFKMKKGKTNYTYHVKLSKAKGLNFIDFNSFFTKNKLKSKYPLYPQYGIHWSDYGAYLAADSMIKYIEKIRKIDMPNLYYSKISMDDAKGTDYDIANGMNLLFKLKSFKMAYPTVEIEKDSGKTKPTALVVSDSYYWQMFGTTFTRALSDNHFWFYNKQVYPEFYQNGMETSMLNIKDEILKHDVIILMATEATLPQFGWGFIENTYNIFKGKSINSKFDPEFKKKVEMMKSAIRQDKNWLNLVNEKAKTNNITLDSMLTIDAIWQVQEDMKKK